MSDPCDNVIDLTNSFNLVNHCNLSDVIIEIDDTDDSFCAESTDSLTKHKNKSTKKTTKKTRAESLENTRFATDTPERRSMKIGECPICCEQLGKKPASSTKCGHVFCLQCLETSLKHDKRCPQCRRLLKGATAYHPLYLPLQ